MSTTIPALSSVTDILDTDLVMVTHSNGESFKIAGSEINKRNQAVIASGTTLTGAPLKTSNIVRVYFTADITGSNTSTGLTLNYNGVNYSVKVPKNGTLANFVASDLGGSPTVYKYLQAHTTLELLYDGTQFIIIGNPVVLSSINYEIYADGYKSIDLRIQTAEISINNHYGKAYLYKSGRIVYFNLGSDWTSLDAGFNYHLGTIPAGFRPVNQTKMTETTVEKITLFVENTGHVYVYNYGTAFTTNKNGQYYGCWVTEE